MELKTALCFDDVLLVPQYSNLTSREQDVDLSFVLDEKRNITLKHPFVSSCMSTISESDMLIAMAKFGGFGIVHRYNTVEEQCEIIKKVRNKDNYLTGAAIGVVGDYLKRAHALLDEGVDILCVDVAHGHSSLVERALKTLRDKLKRDVHIIAGNIATQEAFENLVSWGADTVRCGIGGGCFVGDTKILMANGNYKNIKDIKIHDKVINKNGESVEVIAVKFSGFKKVLKYRHPDWEGYCYATPEHLHYVGNDEFLSLSKTAYVCVLYPKHIKPDNGLEIKNIAYVNPPILEKEYVETLMPTYDIEVDCPTHTFVANNCVVHNSICSTRIRTGCGVPLLQTIFDCSESSIKSPIMADGGIKNAGDMVKAFAAGAHLIMCGSLFAGTDECPCEIIEQDGIKYMHYSGMASRETTAKIGKKYSVEGISTLVPYRGSVLTILEEIKENVKSGFSLCGSRNISELQEKAIFIRQTSMGQFESDTHILYRK